MKVNPSDFKRYGISDSFDFESAIEYKLYPTGDKRLNGNWDRFI